MKLSAVILTKNEEKNIDRCLKSLDFCDEVIIIDDYSNDNTKNQISKIKNQNDKFNIKIYENHLNNDFGSQRNIGLEKSKNQWVLFVDADEVVSDGLKSEITDLKFDQDAYFIRRRDFFWGHEMKFGEVKKVRDLGLVRLVKKNSGKWMGNVHEVFYTAKNTGHLSGFLDHYPHTTLKEFIADVNMYSQIRAEELYTRGSGTNVFEIMFFPLTKFIYNYFFNFGFFDGPAGFCYSFMMSFHSFLVRSKLYQLTKR